MKNTILLLLFSAIFIFSCDKSDNKPSSQLPSKAETKPQYDNTSFGVYKGVIIGSSGYIVFRINNGNNDIKGDLTIDGRKDILTTTQTITAGQPIVNVKFTGSFSSMTLNADSNGEAAEITDISIDGHPGNVAGVILHEKSTKQVFCYEGKLAGSPGILNCIRIGEILGDTAGGFVKAIAKFNKDTLYVGAYMVDRNNQITIRPDAFPFFRGAKFLIQGKFDKETFNGTWDFSEVYGKGNFSCIRTY